MVMHEVYSISHGQSPTSARLMNGKQGVDLRLLTTFSLSPNTFVCFDLVLVVRFFRVSDYDTQVAFLEQLEVGVFLLLFFLLRFILLLCFVHNQVVYLYEIDKGGLVWTKKSLVETIALGFLGLALRDQYP